MEALAVYGSLSDLMLLLGLSTSRIAVAFMLVPLFTSELIPAMVRNSMFVGIALLTLLLQPSPGPLQTGGFALTLLFAKEAFIGAAIGFFFAGVMWAFEAAGQLIDTKIGSSMAQVSDPLTGSQVTLNAALFGRLASWVFMAGGGFMLMMGALLQSYALWPVHSPMPPLNPGGMQLFETEFGRIMLLTLLISAPALLLLYVVEGILGLINRFAQQLNVFSLSMSIKAVAGVWIIWMQLALMVQFLQDDFMSRGGVVIQTLRALFGR
ncbi:MAG TPA: type III secretion system export apparatus subunit SctT [Burkholderiaceae bacterium]|nr:type III secretion system export apparatus subunit SctT [Burkholderiaceae bacterium]